MLLNAKMFPRPETKVSYAPYPKIGRALSGINFETDDIKIITILTSIIGSEIKVTLEIALNPSIFIIAVIVTNTRMTISKSIFGKYIRTKLSANVLITNPDIVRKYIHIATPKAILSHFPPVYSHISIISLLGNRSNTFDAR